MRIQRRPRRSNQSLDRCSALEAFVDAFRHPIYPLYPLYPPKIFSSMCFRARRIVLCNQDTAGSSPAVGSNQTLIYQGFAHSGEISPNPAEAFADGFPLRRGRELGGPVVCQIDEVVEGGFEAALRLDVELAQGRRDRGADGSAGERDFCSKARRQRARRGMRTRDEQPVCPREDLRLVRLRLSDERIEQIDRDRRVGIGAVRDTNPLFRGRRGPRRRAPGRWLRRRRSPHGSR